MRSQNRERFSLQLYGHNVSCRLAKWLPPTLAGRTKPLPPSPSDGGFSGLPYPPRAERPPSHLSPLAIVVTLPYLNG